MAKIIRYTSPVYDIDAEAFISAIQLTNIRQTTAINDLVIDLKGFNLWNKMLAIYPIIGGTESSHKYNLKDPRDLDIAFRLVFSGTVTHSSTGMLGNGVNGIADTKINPNTNLQQNDWHLSFYSRTDQNTTVVEFGSRGTNIINDCFLELRTANITYYGCNGTPGTTISFADTDSRGFYLGTRTSSTTPFIYKNAVLKDATNRTSSTLNTRNLYLLGFNNNGVDSFYSGKECAFATAGSGLTSIDSVNLYNTIQKYQSFLNRQI